VVADLQLQQPTNPAIYNPSSLLFPTTAVPAAICTLVVSLVVLDLVVGAEAQHALTGWHTPPPLRARAPTHAAALHSTDRGRLRDAGERLLGKGGGWWCCCRRVHYATGAACRLCSALPLRCVLAAHRRAVIHHILRGGRLSGWGDRGRGRVLAVHEAGAKPHACLAAGAGEAREQRACESYLAQVSQTGAASCLGHAAQVVSHKSVAMKG
jgi:hypothetical protein